MFLQSFRYPSRKYYLSPYPHIKIHRGMEINLTINHFGHEVYVSEYTCPLDNATIVYEKEIINTLDKKKKKTGIEKLFKI